MALFSITEFDSEAGTNNPQPSAGVCSSLFQYDKIFALDSRLQRFY
jgi:hypothetical protein